MGIMYKESLLNKLKNRVSHKTFTGEVIPDSDIDKIVEALNMTPTSMGLQLTKTIMIKSDWMKESLKRGTYYQPQVDSCSHLVVLLTKKGDYKVDVFRYVEDFLKVRSDEDGEAMKLSSILNNFIDNKSHGELLAWARNQTYITLGNLVTYCASLDIATCPIEGFIPAYYEKELGDLIEGYEPTVVCAIGYGDENDKRFIQKKIRISNDSYNIDII